MSQTTRHESKVDNTQHAEDVGHDHNSLPPLDRRAALRLLSISTLVTLAGCGDGTVPSTTASAPSATPTGSILLTAGLLHIPDDLNQSLGQGQFGIPLLSTAANGFPLYPNNLMFNSGVRCGSPDGSTVTAANLARFVH